MPQMKKDKLPGILAEIAEKVGFEGALSIAREYGGQGLYFRRGGRANPKLIGVLGNESAEKLSLQYGGSFLYIPFARKELAQSMAERGNSVKEIASSLGVSRRTVHRYFSGS